MEKRINLPLGDEAESLQAGDPVLLSGTVYVARDAAHKKMMERIERGEKLPFEINGACIYYMGPSPAPPGEVIGSAGPTTSHRMDAYTPALLDLGLKAMIGKGNRGQAVIEAIERNGAVYLTATGGLGATLASSIKESEVIAWPELGAEAVRKIRVEDFPAIVAIDSRGENLYTCGRAQYQGQYKKIIKKESERNS